MSIQSSWKSLGSHTIPSPEKIEVALSSQDTGDVSTYKGVAQLPFSIPRLAFILEDIETRKKWVSRLADEILIAQNEEDFSFVTYEHYDMQWPVSDREYVLEGKWTILEDTPTTAVSLLVHSIERDEYPLRKDRVRGDLKRLYYLFERVSTNETKITVEIQVDPEGDLPNFFVNMIQKNWPLNTLTALYNESKKGEQEHDLLKKALNK
ncbi:START domain-containing protein [Flammeovirga kamogawensis]|uniref:START domain-containing protein n=1 Tax=Flammeovirga kamogawensis TaxID=373891 RepID=A0ABX8GQW0_9BACT|nr:START domain-containing protein [Flammeovirga kamogawensis]MBB6463035.1 hypothetical protein [Flammeovirga kamogawensis]QWG05672.1 hypothetical protein KM029_09780 [Flammeovirga kamogawensis]TRX67502.1 hypothetical protein EO216_04815 [Flammeovirga kamogawensis]